MYVPIIKTGEAEVRAIEKLTSRMLDGITPLIELTRGRQKTIQVENGKIVTHPYDKRLEKVRRAFKGKRVFLDLTTDELLLSDEVYDLYDYQGGYEKWCTFIENNSNEDGFGSIIPSILFNWQDPDFEINFELQVKRLSNFNHSLMYRSTIQTKDCYDEIPIILKYLPKDCELWIVLDGGYLQDSAVELAVNRCRMRIQNIKQRLLLGKKAHFIVAATSYPDRVTDYSNENPIVIHLSEVSLYNQLKNDFPEIIYGDYAGVNPIRKDLIVMARGWIPRIDVPSENATKVYWRRRPKGVTEYRGTYIRVAEDAISDPEFPVNLSENWGISEIINCSYGYVTSSVPGFWISVRMYNHIYTQLDRINSLTIGL